MARLTISLLGTFQVNLDGGPVTTIESDKVRALLAYLVVESERLHRREKLASLLWPDRTERNARRNLSQALFNLRCAIGDREAKPPFLLATYQTIQFNPHSDYWLDVAALAELLDTCREHRHHCLETCDLCMGRLQRAAALHRGAFLEGFSLKGCAAFEEWALLEDERSNRLAMEALIGLVHCYEQRGEYVLALEHAWRCVELAPWREKAHRQLMRLLASNGDRGAALAQYDACRRALMEDLGIEPEPKTIKLYERIRDGMELPDGCEEVKE